MVVCLFRRPVTFENGITFVVLEACSVILNCVYIQNKGRDRRV